MTVPTVASQDCWLGHLHSISVIELSEWHDFTCFFFFQAEDGIRDLVRSRGLGDVYKRQV